MADKNIGSLPTIITLDDGSLMVVEQQGKAMKMTGAQVKEFVQQSVNIEVQGYVEEAKAAAESAQNAASAVVDMTVEARDLEQGQAAAVEKSIKNGKVNLAFGLPRGAQGIPGPEGKSGPRGPKGETGSGLKILGYYGTPGDLEAAQPAPQPGDAYGVGAEAPYDIYVFDGVSGQWKNNGPLTGAGGAILPENVVTSEGGGTVAVSSALGDAPWEMRITEEEEPPLTAGDIVYNEEQTVAQAIDGLFTSVSSGKALVASAITDKGVPTQPDATFAQMAGNIGQIATGASTGDATATPGDILAPKTAYTASGKVTGIIPTLAAQTLTPGTADQTLAAGQYLGGRQTILGDPNLLSGNIRKGVRLFGVEGAVEQTFMATLTVTVDVGAVVTATLGDTQVSALCTTGQVTLELPAEGAWTVTAVRGVTQYNSVVVTVSASYAASLTAEVHIVYFGAVTPLSKSKWNLVAASAAGHALFAGGQGVKETIVGGHPWDYYDSVDGYNAELTLLAVTPLNIGRAGLAGAVAGDQILFAGGREDGKGSVSYVNLDTVSVYSASLVRTEATALSAVRTLHSGESVGGHAVFAGGRGNLDSSTYAKSSVVDAYSASLERTTPTALAVAGECAAAANSSYAMFCNKDGTAQISAYSASLSRSIPRAPSGLPLGAARAGNYGVFANGETADAYDLFLTRTQVEGLGEGAAVLSAVTLKDFAVIVTDTEAVVYDPFLTRTVQTGLTLARTYAAAAAIGNYALIAGGQYFRNNSSWDSDMVEAYRYE